MTESEFLTHTDQVFRHLQDQLDASGLDLEMLWSGNVLEIECPDGSKIVVNRHVPNQELWIAARSGGYHFAWRQNEWLNTRDGGEFYATLSECLCNQTGEECGLHKSV